MTRAPFLLMILLAPMTAWAGEGWTIAISGEVRAGEHFTAELPGGLVFALDATREAPPNPPG